MSRPPIARQNLAELPTQTAIALLDQRQEFVEEAIADIKKGVNRIQWAIIAALGSLALALVVVVLKK